MSDRLVRGTFPGSNVRFAICETARLCSEGVHRLNSDWISSWLLSEALTCAALLSVGLKDEERVSLRWGYTGPIGTILTDTDEKAQVRGFTQRLRLMPEVETLQEALGEGGRISAVSSLPDRVGQKGITEAPFADITRDLAYFLSLSFQIETGIAVGLIIRPDSPIQLTSATGLLLQPLPGCDPIFFDRLRTEIERPQFRQWLAAEPRSPEEALARLQVGEEPAGGRGALVSGRGGPRLCMQLLTAESGVRTAFVGPGGTGGHAGKRRLRGDRLSFLRRTLHLFPFRPPIPH